MDVVAQPSRSAPPEEATAAVMVERVARSRSGDREAFGALVLELQKPLYFAVFRLTGNPQDARDIVQRAFLKAWERLEELESPQKFRSWLFTIALNMARNHRRDTGRRRTEPIEERTLVSPATAPETIDAGKRRKMLRAAMEALPPKQREVVSLRIDAELTFRQIGEAVGCSEASARVNFHHGMKRLREQIGTR